MYYSFFIHSSVDGHIGCFHVLAIINSAAMNEQWDTCVFFNFDFLKVYAQEWDCWVIWWFYSQFFKDSPFHLPQWLYQFTFPSTVQESSLFSTLSPAFIACRLFDDGHSDWCEVISHCSFDLHFSKGNPIYLTSDLSAKTLQARREWQDMFKVLKRKKLHPRLLYPARI